MDRSIKKEYSFLLKGYAVLLMVSGHLLMINWIKSGIELKDIWVFGETFTGMLVVLINSCVHIFAFLTGYIWCVNFHGKSKWKRALDIYKKYWGTLVLVFLCYLLFGGYANRQVENINFINELLGIDTQLSIFSWYIPFFALAVFTYPIYLKLLKKIRLNPYLILCVVILFGMGGRLIGRVLYKFGIIDVVVLNLLSRYFTTMPSVLQGSVVMEYGIFDKWNEKIKQREKISVALFCILAMINFFVQYVLEFKSNLDNITIIFYMWAILNIARQIKESSFIYKILKLFGEYSLYIWLIHCIFFLDKVQRFTYILKVPILVILMVMFISLGISVVIKKLEILDKQK